MTKFDSNQKQNLAEIDVCSILQMTYPHLKLNRIKDSASTDIEIRGSDDCLLGVCEVSLDADQESSRIENELRILGNWRDCSLVNFSWFVYLDTNFKTFSQLEVVDGYLRALEELNVHHSEMAICESSRRIVESMRRIGICLARATTSTLDKRGYYLLNLNSSALLTLDSKQIDVWIINSLKSKHFSKKIKKLKEFRTEKKHLAIVVDNNTPHAIKHALFGDYRQRIGIPMSDPNLDNALTDLWVIFSSNTGWWHWNAQTKCWQITYKSPFRSH